MELNLFPSPVQVFVKDWGKLTFQVAQDLKGWR